MPATDKEPTLASTHRWGRLPGAPVHLWDYLHAAVELSILVTMLVAALEIIALNRSVGAASNAILVYLATNRALLVDEHVEQIGLLRLICQNTVSASNAARCAKDVAGARAGAKR